MNRKRKSIYVRNFKLQKNLSNPTGQYKIDSTNTVNTIHCTKPVFSVCFRLVFVLPFLTIMKLFSVLVLYKGDPKPHIMKGAFDLASFSFFQRGTVQEMLCFTAKTLAERTQIGERQSVKEAEYMIHVFVRSDSLVGVCLSDHEYPHRVAHTMLTKVLEDFTNQVPRHVWPEGKEVSGCSLDDYLKKYQNPVEADPMMKVQNELDETKIILHNTIETVLQRGEKLDDLVAKSEGLSMQSKTFYKTAKKTNACCSSWS